jgi:AcrR family transcriptional regulator
LPAPSSEVRAEQRRATRQRILDAARALLLKRGYGGATVDAIAARAGVSVQTVYNAVGGKAAVLKAVYAERFGLPVGMTVTEAGDILWTLTAPEIAYRLIHRRGWSLDRFEAWTADVMHKSLSVNGEIDRH